MKVILGWRIERRVACYMTEKAGIPESCNRGGVLRSDFRNQRFEPDTWKTRKMRKVLAEPHLAVMFSCQTLTRSAKVPCRTLQIADPERLTGLAGHKAAQL